MATLDEITQSIQAYIRDHEMVHSMYESVDCKASFLKEAWEQVLQTVRLVEMGIEPPENHRAEAYLIMLLEQSTHHGYTPKRKEKG
jgi:hypothetical protein